MEKFKKLGLSAELIKAIEEQHIKIPSEIQEKAIPLALAGKDIIGGSATGSGKTLAFGTPIIEKIEHGKGVQSLILTPTRELAEQVCKSLIIFSKYKRLSITAVYGGVDIKPQERQILKSEVVVGTPGRILDHLDRRNLNLNKVKILVLDEADRMLDMGFIEDVKKIIGYCPIERQTLLFSATINQDINYLAGKYMKNPEFIETASYVDPSKLKQVYYDVLKEEKFSLLVHLLREEHAGLIMVFCNTRNNADFVAANLARYDIDAIATHGGLNQNKRNRIMESFHKNKIYVLICTDVAARGLDIKGVSHIYNYDLPATGKEYIHRIGRTARAGKEGRAISLVSQRDYENFARIKRNPELNIERLETPKFEKVYVRFDIQGGRGSRGGGRRPFRSGGFRKERRFERTSSREGGGSSGGFGGRSGGFRRSFRGRDNQRDRGGRGGGRDRSVGFGKDRGFGGRRGGFSRGSSSRFGRGPFRQSRGRR